MLNELLYQNMVNWKLIRHLHGNEEYTLTDGEKITVGRGFHNKIILTSSVISRNHCLIDVHNNNIFITDLQSSNGVYIGKMKIPPNSPYCIDDSTLIGIGWTVDASLPNIQDTEKYVFKLIKENTPGTLTSRFEYQSDNELDHIKKHIAESCNSITTLPVPTERQVQQNSPILGNKLSLKRKTDNNFNKDKIVPKNNLHINRAIVISDSDDEHNVNPTEFSPKKPKLKPICEESHQLFKDNCVKNEHEVEYEAFNVKQEYFGYNDEPIQIDSESDSESEQWLLRLSQSSPGKPFTKTINKTKLDIKQEENSYSQLDDFVCDEIEDEEYMDDIISIPPKPCDVKIDVRENSSKQQTQHSNERELKEAEEFCDDIITIIKPPTPIKMVDAGNKDNIDSFICEKNLKEPEKIIKVPNNAIKKVQIIEPLVKLSKGKSCQVIIEGIPKDSSRKHKKVQKSNSKRHITNSQKEERKKKLKEIAIKDKDSEEKYVKDSTNSSTKPINNIKITASNRGAFLTGVIEPVVKPTNKIDKISTNTKPSDDVEKKEKHEKSDKNKHKETIYKFHSKTETKSKINKSAKEQETRVSLKFLKPLTDSEESFSRKPLSKVGPVQSEKFKKKVHFSDSPPQVRVFQIEPGNRMKKTSLVKTTLVDVRQKPLFSLDKITLMKILRWNPQWLEEQMNNNDPPPILGHNNTPMTIFHSFVNHNQYVQLIGDLLLMEIWECLTIPYMRTRNSSNNSLQMRIQSLPPAPPHEHCLDLFSFSVNVSLPSVEAKNVPRVGEILLVTFGPDNAKNQRFFFVNNVRTLPSPSSNKNSFFSLSLQVTFTDKIKLLRPGELIIGRSLAYINNELMLFEAMEYLVGSPLSDIILKPEPYHFINEDNQKYDLKSQWTATLNSSQLAAVSASVTAALGDKPCIKMVQGPPGTGKSSVICAIVMTYFYSAQGKKHQNRGKILICATSNAAVDGLAVKLLNLRQSLPKPERFRMVRVGRAEAMHPVAGNVSSQQLAHRDLTRVLAPHNQAAPAAHPGFDEEILHLQAKINMWKSAEQNAQDPVRVAYCQGRVADLVKRITLMREGGGAGSGRAARGEPRPEQLAAAERRIIEGADIIVTTLASAQNHKMRGLKRRIALCIIDEAGQAIEPETLIPLTLDVTKLTLVGDPQQLPGFICSQRAKKHGLSESLFSRLASYTENWPGGSPVILLNQQYRMHPDIADYPSRAFYDGRIQSFAPPRPDLPIPPYAIISISSGDRGQGISGANEIEAWGVSRLVVALENVLRTHNLKLAVITPYNGHKELIKKNLRLLQQPGEAQVEVNTVDSFQGQERDVVVVSLARSQGVGFLTDTGRMNVMLTRARHALLICLNPNALLKNPQWRTLVEDAQRRNLYRIFPNKVCQPPNSGQEPTDDILKYLVEQKSGSYRRR